MLVAVAKRRDGQRLEVCGRIQKEFGRRFREARVKSGRLQRNIAVEMSLTRTTISNIERGTQRLYLDQVFQAAHVLSVDLPTLLPNVGDVYVAPAIRTATDAPLPDDTTHEAERIVREVTTDERSGRKERKPPHKRR